MRVPRRLICALLGVVFAFVPPDAVLGQEVGYVDRIKEDKKVTAQTDAARLFRAGADGSPLSVRLRLLDQDLLRVDRPGLLVDLFFDRAGLKSDVYLGTRQDGVTGAYVIRDTTIDALSTLQLVVQQGVLVVDHAAGRLETVAAGIRTWIKGTKVLFSVDPGATDGVLFLAEGSISFPDYEMEASGEGRAWRLRRGQQPIELFLTGPELRRWERELTYNSEAAWRPARPFWKQPRFLIPLGGVLIGSAVLCASDVICGGGYSRDGYITIRLP